MTERSEKEAEREGGWAGCGKESWVEAKYSPAGELARISGLLGGVHLFF